MGDAEVNLWQERLGCKGPTHFAFELNLLAQVDELLCPPHPLDVVIAVPDQLRVEQGEEREEHCVRGCDLGVPSKKSGGWL